MTDVSRWTTGKKRRSSVLYDNIMNDPSRRAPIICFLVLIGCLILLSSTATAKATAFNNHVRQLDNIFYHQKKKIAFLTNPKTIVFDEVNEIEELDEIITQQGSTPKETSLSSPQGLEEEDPPQILTRQQVDDNTTTTSSTTTGTNNNVTTTTTSTADGNTTTLAPETEEPIAGDANVTETEIETDAAGGGGGGDGTNQTETNPPSIISTTTGTAPSSDTTSSPTSDAGAANETSATSAPTDSQPTNAPAVTQPTTAPTTVQSDSGNTLTTSSPDSNNNSTETESPQAIPTSGPTTLTNTSMITMTMTVTVNSSFLISTQPANWTTPTTTDNSNPVDLVDAAPKGSIDGLRKAYSELAGSVVSQLNPLIMEDLNSDIVRRNPQRQRWRRRRRLPSVQQQNHQQQGEEFDDSPSRREQSIVYWSEATSKRTRELQQQQQTKQALKSTVNYDPSTAMLIGLRPGADCPSDSSTTGTAAVCLTAYGQYDLEVTETEDPNAVYNVFVQETQKAIDDGVLQQQLEKVDPNNIFVVQGASEPVIKPPLGVVPETTTTTTPTTTTTTVAPTPNQEKDAEAKDDGGGGLDGVMLGLIIAMSITVFLVAILLGVYFYLKHSTRNDKDSDGSGEEENKDKDPENPETAPVPDDDDNDDNVEDGEENDGAENNWPSGLQSGDLLDSSAAADDEQEREYKRRVEELVAENCPEESENVSRMMEQFKGREKALIAMLENMDEVERELEEEQGRDPDEESSSEDDDDGGDWSEEDPPPQHDAENDKDEEEAKMEVSEISSPNER